MKSQGVRHHPDLLTSAKIAPSASVTSGNVLLAFHVRLNHGLFQLYQRGRMVYPGTCQLSRFVPGTDLYLPADANDSPLQATVDAKANRYYLLRPAQ